MQQQQQQQVQGRMQARRGALSCVSSLSFSLLSSSMLILPPPSCSRPDAASVAQFSSPPDSAAHAQAAALARQHSQNVYQQHQREMAMQQQQQHHQQQQQQQHAVRARMASQGQPQPQMQQMSGTSPAGSQVGSPQKASSACTPPLLFSSLPELTLPPSSVPATPPFVPGALVYSPSRLSQAEDARNAYRARLVAAQQSQLANAMQHSQSQQQVQQQQRAQKPSPEANASTPSSNGGLPPAAPPPPGSIEGSMPPPVTSTRRGGSASLQNTPNTTTVPLPSTTTTAAGGTPQSGADETSTPLSLVEIDAVSPVQAGGGVGLNKRRRGSLNVSTSESREPKKRTTTAGGRRDSNPSIVVVDGAGEGQVPSGLVDIAESPIAIDFATFPPTSSSSATPALPSTATATAKTNGATYPTTPIDFSLDDSAAFLESLNNTPVENGQGGADAPMSFEQVRPRPFSPSLSSFPVVLTPLLALSSTPSSTPPSPTLPPLPSISTSANPLPPSSVPTTTTISAPNSTTTTSSLPSAAAPGAGRRMIRRRLI